MRVRARVREACSRQPRQKYSSSGCFESTGRRTRPRGRRPRHGSYSSHVVYVDSTLTSRPLDCDVDIAYGITPVKGWPERMSPIPATAIAHDLNRYRPASEGSQAEQSQSRIGGDRESVDRCWVHVQRRKEEPQLLVSRKAHPDVGEAARQGPESLLHLASGTGYRGCPDGGAGGRGKDMR